MLFESSYPQDKFELVFRVYFALLVWNEKYLRIILFRASEPAVSCFVTLFIISMVLNIKNQIFEILYLANFFIR